jgi:hypothetical protein
MQVRMESKIDNKPSQAAGMTMFAEIMFAIIPGIGVEKQVTRCLGHNSND